MRVEPCANQVRAPIRKLVYEKARHLKHPFPSSRLLVVTAICLGVVATVGAGVGWPWIVPGLALFGLGALVRSGKGLRPSASDERNALLESIATLSPTIFFTLDLASRKVLYANRSIPAALGYSEQETAAMGENPMPSVIFPEDLDLLFKRLQELATLSEGSVNETEIRFISAQGQMRWLLFRDVVFRRDEAGAPSQILVNVVDVTERKNLGHQVEDQILEIQDSNLALEIQSNALAEANTQLESLAFTDGLTGISNHRSFQEALARAFAEARTRHEPLALLLIDVDHFKQYNDTYGHPSGDIVLKRVASVIRDSCGSDSMAARYGGEEFAVICRRADADHVAEIAERIRANVANTPWPERPVTISVGVAHMPDGASSASNVLAAADSALYTSKSSGRNRVTIYEPSAEKRLAA